MFLDYHVDARASCALFVLVLSCGSKSDELQPRPQPEPAPTTEANEPSEPRLRCAKAPFAKSVTLPEASAATVISGLGVLVISDSRHDGSYRILAAESGKAIESGRLPIDDEISDDIEGVSATADDSIVALTSSGMVLEFSRQGDRFTSKRDAYPIGPKIPGCTARRNNCGMNWEGLCIGPISGTPLAGCVGLAVSKERGSLHCLTRNEDDELTIETDRSVDVAKRGVLSGCSISNGAVWVTANALGGNAIYQISAERTLRFTPLLIASIEAIAAVETESGDATDITLFSDTNRGPSLAFRYRCSVEL